MSRVLNERCNKSLDLVFESMVQSGLLSPENCQCLELMASHGQGTELLVVAIVLLIGLSHFFLLLVQKPNKMKNLEGRDKRH